MFWELKMKNVKITIDGIHELPVKVANSISSRAKGLQGIQSLNGEGMIFVFSDPKIFALSITISSDVYNSLLAKPDI